MARAVREWEMGALEDRVPRGASTRPTVLAFLEDEGAGRRAHRDARRDSGAVVGQPPCAGSAPCEAVEKWSVRQLPRTAHMAQTRCEVRNGAGHTSPYI